MSVDIRSYVPSQAGGTLTDGSVTLVAPNQSVTGNLQIGSVVGLQAALDSKLSDTVGSVGGSVVVTGLDLNLLSGMSAYGLLSSDFQKLADTVASSTELNFLSGTTSSVQSQLDVKNGPADYATDNDIHIGTGAGTGGVENFATVLGEYEFNDLLAATTDLDINGQKIINSASTVGGDSGTTLTTKDYVDGVIGSGAFVAVDGSSEMTGDLNINGNNIILDADGNSVLTVSDDSLDLSIGGTSSFIFSASGIDFQGNSITDLADPATAQGAATRNYVDTTALLLTGGIMTGDMDFDGNTLILDADGDSSIVASTDDTIEFNTGGGTRLTITDSGFDLAGLLASNAAEPVGDQDLATKNYVDTTTFPIDGGTLTGDLDVGGNSIINVLDPTLGTHVGDRDYNDARYSMISNNLSDLTNAATARSNLGLSTVAATGDFTDLINQPAYDLNDIADFTNITPGASEDTHVVQWDNGSSNYVLAAAPVISAFGRTGAVVAAAGDYNAGQVTFTPVGDIAAITVQSAMAELDTEKMALAGGTMSGNINMNSNDITNIGTLGITGHTFNSTSYASSLGDSFYLRTTNVPADATPTYSFGSDTTSGFWWNGAGIAVSVGGANQLNITTTELDVSNNKITNVGNPTENDHAVNLAHINGLGMTKILGSATGVDMLDGVGTTVPIYVVPTGETHIITQILVVASSFVPGVTPEDAIISVGIGGPDYDQIIEVNNLSWGSAGAADQVVYLFPKQGSSTPNSSSTVSLLKDTLAAGTYSELVIDVYVVGFQI